MFFCESAGVMYWGDMATYLMEKADLDGNGRTVLANINGALYSAFVLHAGNIYFTDWTNGSLYL